MRFTFPPDIPLPSPQAIKDTIANRGLYRTNRPVVGESTDPYKGDPDRLPATHATATLVGSMLPTGNHMPVIDLDLPCMLVPSSSPGHFHLYINRAMSFEQMMDMLREMVEAGVVQPGFYDFTNRRGEAFVRYPGVTKQNEAERIAEGE